MRGEEGREGEGEEGREREVRLLSLNCWGLRILSKYRKQRLLAIGDRLALSSYDIVALQEIWSQADFERVCEKCKHLSYSKFYYGGAFGAGLAILSRWPIEETSMHCYPLNGRPQAFWRGDWYVGKGYARAIIVHPSGEKLEVLNTHVGTLP